MQTAIQVIISLFENEKPHNPDQPLIPPRFPESRRPCKPPKLSSTPMPPWTLTLSYFLPPLPPLRRPQELVKGIETLAAPPVRQESLSDRVRRADLDDQEASKRNSLELSFHSVVDLGDKRCTKSLAFHPYEPLLVASDDEDCISIYNFREGKR